MLHRLVTPTVLTVGFAAAVVTASSVPAAADNDESTGLPRTQDIVEELRDDGVFVDPDIEVGTARDAVPQSDIAGLENAAAQADEPVHYVLIPEGNATSEVGV